MTNEQYINDLKEKAASNGGKLTYDEINDVLNNADLDKEKVDEIYEKIMEMGISIDIDSDVSESSDIDAVSDEEDDDMDEKETVIDIENTLPKSIAVDDPVRMYLKEIGKVPLLSAEEEIELAKRMEDVGVEKFIFTDINRDGMLTGPNLVQLEVLSNSVSADIVASGGVSDLTDIKDLMSLNIFGAICGKSIYEGTLNLPKAIKLTRG